MILRRSRFVHVLSLGDNRALILHALTHMRLGVDDEVARIIAWFDTPRNIPAEVPQLVEFSGYSLETLAGCVESLMERGVLTNQSMEEELAQVTGQLRETNGRDPGEMLEKFRRKHQEGGNSYWSAPQTRGITRMASAGERLDVILFGDCDLQMEADFLVQEGAASGLDLRVAASFPDDLRLAAEHKHDAIILGALRARKSIMVCKPEDHDGEPYRPYVANVFQILEHLRTLTDAPILLDNLPEPTVQPFGLAERGLQGHRNRFRRANLALAELAASFTDVHLIDVAAALGEAGSQNLLDDGLTSFIHFGSLGWMLQRPQKEKQAVHNIFPEMDPLEAMVGGDPYRREKVLARIHADTLMSVMGLDRKKCIIVDLDGVMWPGVLAETGSPFAWHPDISGPFSYIGLFFGIHEALKILKQRGIVLAAVSKNDEAVVRDLWTYPEHYPHERLITPDDFVTWRVNWNDKAQNIMSIAEELGFALNTFVFIDDRPIERENVKQKLPEVEVWGEELFSLRRRLLTDPRLQIPRLTAEAETRTELVKAQLDRARLRTHMTDEATFIASLEVNCQIEKLTTGAPLERIQELFERTTQFNTTGRKFSLSELADMLAHTKGQIFSMHVSDRFGDHGLVGAAVVVENEIIAYAMSCRVIGMGVDQRFLAAIVDDLKGKHREIHGRIIETARNIPVRNLYKDKGFQLGADGSWSLPLLEAALI